jgi:hypothetical protein
MIFLKIALGVFFLRILVERWQRWVVYNVVTLASLFGFGYFVYTIFQCGVPSSTDGSRFWEKEIDGKCYSKPAEVLGLGYAHAIITALSDVCLAIVPIPVLKKARIKRREKIIVWGILLLGSV